MNMQLVRWCVDLAMGVVFLFSAMTGIIKFLFLVHAPGISSSVLPMAFVSDVHDRAGIALALLVALHLYLNRAWIQSMTKKMLAGTADLS